MCKATRLTRVTSFFPSQKSSAYIGSGDGIAAERHQELDMTTQRGTQESVLGDCSVRNKPDAKLWYPTTNDRTPMGREWIGLDWEIEHY